MKFLTALIATFAALALAAPAPHQKRGGVLGIKTYDEISISGGTAGDAEAEALAVFSALDLNNMAAVDTVDIDFVGAVNNIANDAEMGVFNPAIAAASGDEKPAFTNSKIKNKVLKLMATKLESQIKAAQGEDTSAKLATETTKLNENIALDKGAVGQSSTKLAFDATTAA